MTRRPLSVPVAVVLAAFAICFSTGFGCASSKEMAGSDYYQPSAADGPLEGNWRGLGGQPGEPMLEPEPDPELPEVERWREIETRNRGDAPLLGDVPTVGELFPESGADGYLAMAQSAADGDDAGTGASDGKPPVRVMVYTADLDLIVEDIDAAPDAVTDAVARFDGYVQQRTAGRVIVRIPAKRFHDFLAELGALGTVQNEQIQAQDVTDQYVDLLARLRSAEAVQARLRKLLERADDVEAALKVEKELKRVDEEIERLKGLLEVLGNRISYSTITVRLATTPRPKPVQVRRFGELPFWWLRELNPNHLWD